MSKKNILIVYAHPNPKSFNGAILEAAKDEFEKNGHEVRVRDLYQIKFQPVLDSKDFEAAEKGETLKDVREEQEAIRWANGLVFVYPIWWYGPPAIFKGWLDRVLQKGFAFDWDENGLRGLLTPDKALLLATTGGTDESLTGDMMEKILTSPVIDGSMKFCGLHDVIHRIFYNVGSVTHEDRLKMLDEVRDLVRKF